MATVRDRLIAPAAVAAAALAAAQPATAGVIDAVLIDDFVVQQEVIASGVPISTAFDANSDAGITAIGGEREIYVRKTAGQDGERVRARTNPVGLNLLRMTIDEANGLVQVIYDGIDGGPPPVGTAFPGINYSGLGGLDLTGGLADPFFELLLTFSDVGGPLRLSVFEQGGGSKFASTTFAVPGGVPSGSPEPLTRDFADFVLNGATTLSKVFSSVGAILLEIDATAVAQEGWDMRIDYVKTRGTEQIPVPATLALLGVGLLGLRLGTRR